MIYNLSTQIVLTIQNSILFQTINNIFNLFYYLGNNISKLYIIFLIIDILFFSIVNLFI